MNKTVFEQYIKNFDFKGLFLDLGWDKDATKETVVVDKEKYVLQAAAQKSGFKIFVCFSPGAMPDKSVRLKIQSKAVAFSHLHLIIFCDAKKTEQKWLLVTREANKPIKRTETSYAISQKPELLYQRTSGLIFELDEQDDITIIDVLEKVMANVHQNSERVTKKFYTEFKTEHKAFIGFIKGIGEVAHRDWYASLMMNRLMFCYFIQKKGFLDGDKDYLRHKLEMCKEKKGKDNFYSFYRWVMKFLFFGGLNAAEQDEDIKKEIGRVPYLNGGLFDEHELEKKYPGIDISDKAFEKVFAFFDRYNWHLDIRPDTSGKEINPDVIGYIFEKYINDRAQMGAYYTKEDITGYISKNCIIPYLMDAVKRKYPKAFSPDGEIWTMVKQSGDAYIYDALKKGVELPLPDSIKQGINPSIEKQIVKDVLNNPPKLLELRKDWNKPAPEEYALPTEIWREVVERRKRYEDIRSKIDAGNIQDVNDFITYNLDITQFAQDVVETTTDAGFLKHFYQELEKVTILDPTCGSGAFLFAALNILEPLYEGCIHRMESFIEEDRKGKHKFFEETIARVTSPEHFNLKYFIYKTIILRNLYGVDIMNEAVEIAKLRLFLKLVAEVDINPRKKNLGLEPLPDIDFNIRAGNTLVGYASEVELEEAINFTRNFKAAKGKKNEQTGFDFDNDLARIKEECEKVGDAFEHYKMIQESSGENKKTFKTAKEKLIKSLHNLKEELNGILHKRYYAELHYDKWENTHQPFHWFAEFYEIIHGKKGFDVIIGNPPYVQYNADSTGYKLFNFKSRSCSNLFAYCIERSQGLLNPNARHAMIVPISLVGNKKMYDLSKLLVTKGTVWFSNFSGDTHPGTLFSGVQQNLTIYLFQPKKELKTFSTDFIRFSDAGEERDYLFANRVSYMENSALGKITLKTGSNNCLSILNKLSKDKQSLELYSLTREAKVWYHNVAHYWVKCFINPPFFRRGSEKPSISSHYKSINIHTDKREILVAILSSSTFYFWYILNSNCRDVSRDDVLTFPISLGNFDVVQKKELLALSGHLLKDLNKNKVRVKYQKKNDLVEYDQFWPQNSKPIMDRIDYCISEHYGFTEEELDFIINYDIKYRMGKELEEEE